MGDGLPDSVLRDLLNNSSGPDEVKLQAGLEWASAHFSATTDDDGPNMQRRGAALAIEAVCYFLRGKVPPRHLDPLVAVLHACTDADYGRKPKLFDSVKNKPNAPRKGSADDTLCANAAACVTALMRLGKGEDEALRRVSQKLGMQASALRRYRDNIADRPERIRSLYDSQVDAAVKLGSAEAVLKRLRKPGRRP